MTLSTTTLNIVGDTNPTCVVPLVAGKAGPWKPFCLGTTCCHSQKISKSPHIRVPALHPSSFMRRQSRSTVSYAFRRSRNTRKRGSWSMLASSWASFNSVIAVPVPLSDLNLWRTSCICRIARRRVPIWLKCKCHLEPVCRYYNWTDQIDLTQFYRFLFSSICVHIGVFCL